MRVLSGIFARARHLGRAVGESVLDSGKAALYVRQLLRGNHAAPSILNVTRAVPDEDAGPAKPDAAAPPPVLLLHGYLATRGSVHLLEDRLTALGHVVMTYRLGSVHLGDIRESAGFIAGKVESLVSQTGVEQVDIVAHSMGGLVALDYLKRLGGDKRVRRLILLGTPTLGTWSALLGLATIPLGRASLQLLPGSSFLQDLGRMPLPPGPEVVAMAGERDWLAPPRTTLLRGVRGLTVQTGHTGLLMDEEVAQTISGILRSPAGTWQADRSAGGLFDGSKDPH